MYHLLVVDILIESQVHYYVKDKIGKKKTLIKHDRNSDTKFKSTVSVLTGERKNIQTSINYTSYISRSINKIHVTGT